MKAEQIALHCRRIREADFTRPITAAAVTLPGFRGRTIINPADTERGNTRRKKQSKSETTCTDNWGLSATNGPFILKHRLNVFLLLELRISRGSKERDAVDVRACGCYGRAVTVTQSGWGEDSGDKWSEARHKHKHETDKNISGERLVSPVSCSQTLDVITQHDNDKVDTRSVAEVVMVHPECCWKLSELWST